MDRFARTALDRYITGNYGEDQFRDHDPAEEEVEEPVADVWTIFRVEGQPGQSTAVFTQTNDDNDDGYPDPLMESWTLRFPTLERALAHTGKSRVGFAGHVVTVHLNGERI